MTKVSGFLFRFSEWVMRFALLHLLWITCSLLGLLIFGLFPATIAMFVVMRKWVMGETEVPILSTFWEAYKKDFLRSNSLGLFVTFIGLFIYFEFTLVVESSSPLLQLSYYPLLGLSVLFGLFFLYLFPTYVHYELKLHQVMKNALFIMILHPLSNIVLLLSALLFYYLVQIIPGILLFFGWSPFAFVVMWTCHQAFLNIQRKKSEQKSA